VRRMLANQRDPRSMLAAHGGSRGSRGPAYAQVAYQATMRRQYTGRRMPVPSYDRFIEPVLRYLSRRQDAVSAREAQEAAAAVLKLTVEDKAETLPSGAEAVYRNRIGWAHERLKRAGYSSSPRRGFWQLTPQGRAFAEAHKNALSDEQVWQIANDNDDSKLGSLIRPDVASIMPLPPSPTESADDRLEGAVAELRATTRGALLEELTQASPKAFERIVLDVLHEIGYGASRSDLQKGGDGSIAGFISLDRLGLEKVYVQVKRAQSTVARAEVQAFFEALSSRGAAKGVFITTATFSPQAVELASTGDRVVLVDGERFADLMIDYEVGVTMRPIRIPKLDSDYFDE
jgi:restriction system protein